MLAKKQLSRRSLLQVGSLALSGVSLPQLLAAEQQSSSIRPGAAKSCILFFMEGGPSHIDLWDLKPEAPDRVRGEFKPVSTKVPGLQVCEHLPSLSQQMHHCALVRSIHHKIVDHNAGAYYCLTGRSPLVGSRLILGPEPNNFPPFGAVLAQQRPTENVLPPFVHLTEMMVNNGQDLPGQRAGFLGRHYDPFVVGDPSVPKFKIPSLQLQKGVYPDRLKRRFELLESLRSEVMIPGQKPEALKNFQERAAELLQSPLARRAFRLNDEPMSTRERYGMPDRKKRFDAREFGGLPHLGQAMLMARRLIEAGVRLVTVGTGRARCQAWDTHRDHFPLLRESLLPYTDKAFSALLADLSASGLLDETLVVAMGEFGRTPHLGQITSGAGASANGRDHWPHCYSALFAGAGINGGAIVGASDAIAAYPADRPVTPEDIAATIYYAMGVDPKTEIHDLFNRPVPLSTGEPIMELFS